jgi:hypothetical protein
MPALSEFYGKTDWEFTFDGAPNAASHRRDHADSRDAEPFTFGKYDQAGRDDARVVCSGDSCLGGMVIGLPLSLLIWVAVGGALYLLF